METAHENFHSSPTPEASALESSTPSFAILPSPWEQVCAILLRKLGRDNYTRCFSGTTASITDDLRVVVHVPNPIHQVWIESNFSGTFADAVAEVLGAAATIEYEIASEPLRPLPANASVEKKAARALLTRNPRKIAPALMSSTTASASAPSPTPA